MFEISNDGNKVLVTVTLPAGKSGQELVDSTNTEIETLVKSGYFFGKHVVLTGRITTAMCLALGHKLAHVCKSVSIFNPQDNSTVLCIAH